jgi:hypothetical protein
MSDKGKAKNIVIGDPRILNISQGGIARKAPDKKTSKCGGARGQAQLSTRARLADSSIMDCPTPARGRSGDHADGSADLSGQSVQRHQPPHKAKKETQGQSTYNAHGRLVKAGPTFDQLLSKTWSTGHPLKQSCRIKRSERRHNKLRLFLL